MKSSTCAMASDRESRPEEPAPTGKLFLKVQRRPANSLPLKIDGDFNPVSDLDERNAAVHPIILPVERHRPRNVPCSGAYAGNCEKQRLGFRYAANRKVAFHLKGGWSGLRNTF